MNQYWPSPIATVFAMEWWTRCLSNASLPSRIFVPEIPGNISWPGVHSLREQHESRLGHALERNKGRTSHERSVHRGHRWTIGGVELKPSLLQWFSTLGGMLHSASYRFLQWVVQWHELEWENVMERKKKNHTTLLNLQAFLMWRLRWSRWLTVSCLPVMSSTWPRCKSWPSGGCEATESKASPAIMTTQSTKWPSLTSRIPWRFLWTKKKMEKCTLAKPSWTWSHLTSSAATIPFASQLNVSPHINLFMIQSLLWNECVAIVDMCRKFPSMAYLLPGRVSFQVCM